MSELRAVDTSGEGVVAGRGAEAGDVVRSGRRRHEQWVAGTQTPPEVPTVAVGTPDGGAVAPRRSIEGVVQIVIMLAIGGAAGAASFTHVHDVAAEHGQTG